MRRGGGIVLFLAAPWWPGCATVTPDPIFPQRASFCSDPSTTTHRSVEVEAGYLVSQGNTMDTPLLAKWGVTETAEVYLGWSPYIRLAERGEDPQGYGDLVLGSRIRFREESRHGPAAAFELFAKLPSAQDADLGTGVVEVFVAGSVTKTFDLATLVGYYQLGVLTNPDGSDTLLEHLVLGRLPDIWWGRSRDSPRSPASSHPSSISMLFWSDSVSGMPSTRAFCSTPKPSGE
jgi:hypothetical protein